MTELPIVMSLLTVTQLFADFQINLILLETARKQHKSFPIIEVVIKKLDQQILNRLLKSTL